jgi:hypothetical protein
MLITAGVVWMDTLRVKATLRDLASHISNRVFFGSQAGWGESVSLLNSFERFAAHKVIVDMAERTLREIWKNGRSLQTKLQML